MVQPTPQKTAAFITPLQSQVKRLMWSERKIADVYQRAILPS